MKTLMINNNTYNQHSFEEIYRKFQPLLKKYAHKYNKYGYEDMYQLASEALLEAYRKYNVSIGVSFPHYAKQQIYFKLSRYHRDQTLVFKAQSNKVRYLMSIDSEIPGTDGLKIEDKIRSEKDFVEDIVDKDLAKQIWSMIDNLNDRHKKIWQLWLKGLEQKEIAKILGVTRNTITNLATAISNQLIREGIPVICMTMIDLLARIKQTFDRSDEATEAEIMKIYEEVPLLVIDDIGSEQPSEWGSTKIFAIINARYEAYMPTIVTTNYAGDELIRRMTPIGPNGRPMDSRNAEKTLDRLKEMCVGIEMNWESWRPR